ncbi:DNA topoisomerase 2-associated protein pat1 [Emericellopsis cladophorae]|uniref:DNA topoisomerase 2-associated protein pat1 n=1 Tax=Emericellopsis cladophorae TaxID=2686198 RepID=A0A9P9Y388_9HYPO|nr:DNA topoisomerase 2-associated protein pat1 [Emericellopsis cladophorae]KAI6782803.1 DNA topoisomerase 2-associated protein pat1 [Emericellopsis cladophorae]
MSFFGFDTSGHDKAQPGFSQAHDPFAGLSGRNADVDDALEFEDTYDGLGDQLDDADDAFNDDTFGGGFGAAPAPSHGGAPSAGKVGKDFDFFGHTAKVSGAIEEEHMRFDRQQPTARPVQQQSQNQYHQPPQSQAAYYASQPVQQAYQPARTGYEKYREPEAMPDLNVDRSIWGIGPSKAAAQHAAPSLQAHYAPQHAPQPPAQPPASRKIMSLEEVEAAMRQPKPASQAPPQEYRHTPPPPGFQQQQHQQQLYQQQQQQQYPPQNLQQLQQQVTTPQQGQAQPVTILQRPQSGRPNKATPPAQQQAPPAQPTQILQNPNRLSGDAGRSAMGHQPHPSQGSLPKMGQLQQHPQFNQMSEEEKAAFLDQETKRAKRNHKIWLLSKDNGLMTPQDKNFITRIQLQQLVSATGNPAERDTDTSIAEDFYYQVYSHIRAGQRQNPTQPLSNFAQTYLFQTGGRHGGLRRHGRPAENHFQRMEQQVQRAVEAAKNKPKNPQLVIAGSLGKISFSNAKTPKPLLNIKRNDSETQRPSSAKKPTHTGLNRRAVLRAVEKVYNTLMKIEDHVRMIPPPMDEAADDALRTQHAEWKIQLDTFIAQLWDELQVHAPVDEIVPHPFIAFLSCAKGKKAIPRIFPHLDFEKRTTILTLIIYHLDQLDVVQEAVVSADTTLNARTRENVELFISTVMPSLMGYFNETGLDIVDGVLNLVAMKLPIDTIAKTRIGVSMLTLILSRAVLLKQTGAGNPEQWEKWDRTFETLFNKLEPSLPYIFPGSVNTGEDVYVWQLLAAMGVTATHDQQTRLVLAVKDRVLDTVQLSKTLPPAMASDRLGSVNLFMRSIGLDVELLQ